MITGKLCKNFKIFTIINKFIQLKERKMKKEEEKLKKVLTNEE